MWQVDNDHYALWRLAHEHRQKPLDELLNSVTVADRSPMLVRPLASALAGKAARFVGWLRGLPQTPADETPPAVISKWS